MRTLRLLTSASLTSTLGGMIARTLRRLRNAAHRMLGGLGGGVRATAEQAAIGQAVGHAGMYGSVPPSIGGAMIVAAGRRIGAAAAAGTAEGPSRRIAAVAAGIVLLISVGLVGLQLTGAPSPAQRALADAVANAPSAGWSVLALNAPELQAAKRICAFAPGTPVPTVESALGFRWDAAANPRVASGPNEDLVVAAARDSVVAWVRVPEGSGTRLIVSASGCDERP
jgi:hypothetical protein